MKATLQIILAYLLSSISVRAGIINVTSIGNSGVGTLRQALLDAANSPGADTILFSPSLSGQSIALISSAGGSAISINDPDGVTVDASALAGGLTITDGTGSSYRHFAVQAGSNVTFRGIILANGGGAGMTQEGGAIWNAGTLVLQRCTFMGNVSSTGGALRSLGPATLTNCTFSGNSANNGGAIHASGNTVVIHCTISGNAAGTGGGVLAAAGSFLSLQNTIIAGNTASVSGADFFNAGNVEVAKPCLLQAAISGSGTVSGNFTLGAPLLNPLTRNGGSLPTMSLQSGSPALDKGLAIGGLLVDQRGLPRRRDGDGETGALPDLGAYEAQVIPAARIGLNFVGGNPGGSLNSTDVAGVPEFAQQNWNNLSADYDGSATGNAPNASGKRDSTGKTVSSLSLWWDSPNVWSISTTLPASANGRLMNGYIDSNGVILSTGVTDLQNTSGAQPYFSLGGLPTDFRYGGYKVVIYTDSESTSGLVNSFWLIGNAGRDPASVSRETTLTPPYLFRDSANFSGIFTRATTRSYSAGAATVAANYIQFDSCMEDAFTVRTEEVLGDAGGRRVSLNALQVVRNELIAVTTTADELDPPGVPGLGVSLREALRDAPSGGGIVFDPALDGAAITLDPVLGELGITESVVIDARGLPNGIAIDGGSGSNRIFSIASECSVALAAVTLSGGDGNRNTDSGSGGAIYNAGQLSVFNCTLTANRATATAARGGAIYNAGGGFMIMSGCTLVENESSLSSGTIHNATNAQLTITHCTFQGHIPGASSTISNDGIIKIAGSILVGRLSNGDGGTTERVGQNIITSLTISGAGLAPTGQAHFITAPQLGELADNGGPSPTMRLLPGSFGINGAPGSPVRADQRGYPTVGSPDLGAYEVESYLPIAGPMQYMESFTGLPSADATWRDFTLLPAWRAQANDGVSNIGTLRYSDGTVSSDGLVNCGSANSTDRALGSKSTGTNGRSNISYAVTFRNISNQPVKLSRLRYTAEHWRTGQAASMQEHYVVFYAVSEDPPLSISSGPSNATAEAGPGFLPMGSAANATLSNPTISTALNGNLTANRAPVDFTPPPGAEPVISPGHYFTLKWTDPNELNFTDGFQALDDVILDFVAAPTSLVLGNVDAGGLPVPLVATPAPPGFRQSGQNELSIAPNSAVLTTTPVPLISGAERCIMLTLDAVETSTTGGFEMEDSILVELLSTTPAGIEVQNLTAEYDLNQDGFLTGGNTPLVDELNSGQKAEFLKWSSSFPLVGMIPAGATSFQLRITSHIDDQPVLPVTEVFKIKDVSVVFCADSDGDGISNAWEWAHGTDANSALSKFELTEFNTAASDFSATVSTVSDRAYQALVSDTLIQWEREGGIAPGNGNAWNFQKPQFEGFRKFLRIQSLPVPVEQD